MSLKSYETWGQYDTKSQVQLWETLKTEIITTQYKNSRQ